MPNHAINQVAAHASNRAVPCAPPARKPDCRQQTHHLRPLVYCHAQREARDTHTHTCLGLRSCWSCVSTPMTESNSSRSANTSGGPVDSIVDIDVARDRRATPVAGAACGWCIGPLGCVRKIGERDLRIRGKRREAQVDVRRWAQRGQTPTKQQQPLVGRFSTQQGSEVAL